MRPPGSSKLRGFAQGQARSSPLDVHGSIMVQPGTTFQSSLALQRRRRETLGNGGRLRQRRWVCGSLLEAGSSPGTQAHTMRFAPATGLRG